MAISNRDLFASAIAIRVRIGIRPHVSWGAPAKTIVKKRRCELGVRFEVHFNIVADPVLLIGWLWRQSRVHARLLFVLLDLCPVPKNSLDVIAALQFQSERNLDPWPFALFGVIVLHSEVAEVAPHLRKSLGVPEVHTLHLVSVLLGDLHGQLPRLVIVSIIEVGPIRLGVAGGNAFDEGRDR